MNNPRPVPRREFLVTATLAAAAAPSLSFAGETTEEKTVFEIGMQTYTFRKFSPAATQEKARLLGIRALEYFPGHYPRETPPETLAANAEADGLRIPSYGVCGFGEDPAAYPAIFEFARALGAGVVTADPHPAPANLDRLEALIRETGVRIAIHNHGPGSRYDRLEDIEHVLDGRDPRLGVCIDTGHFLRSKVDPAQAARALKGRIHGVHLKDIRSHDDHTDVVFGQGLLDAGAFLEALDEAGYKGPLMIEYESDPEDPTDAVRACIRYLTETFPDRVKSG